MLDEHSTKINTSIINWTAHYTGVLTSENSDFSRVPFSAKLVRYYYGSFDDVIRSRR